MLASVSNALFAIALLADNQVPGQFGKLSE